MSIHDDFLSWLQIRYSNRNTIYAYSQLFKYLITYYAPSGRVNQEVIEQFCLHKQYPLARTFLRVYCKYAKITNVEIPRMHSRKSKLPVFVTKEEVNFLVRTTDNLQEKVLFLLLFEGGLRAHEIGLLRRTNVDFITGQIRGVGKGNKEFIINITKTTGELLKQYLSSHNDILIFPKMYRKKVYRIVNSKKGLLGKDRLFPHSFRHGLATYLLKIGWNLKELQEYMRHEHLETLEGYTHVLREDINKKWAQTMETKPIVQEVVKQDGS